MSRRRVLRFACGVLLLAGWCLLLAPFLTFLISGTLTGHPTQGIVMGAIGIATTFYFLGTTFIPVAVIYAALQLGLVRYGYTSEWLRAGLGIVMPAVPLGLLAIASPQQFIKAFEWTNLPVLLSLLTACGLTTWLFRTRWLVVYAGQRRRFG